MMFMRKTRDLRTFSKRVETRYIALSDKIDINEATKSKLLNVVKRINKNLDLYIQELSLKIPERQIPFIKVNLGERASNNRLRILVGAENDSIDEKLPKYINIKKISHLIKFKITPGYKQIILSQENSELNAEMLIDEEYIVCAATDIFLDIAMFNSFSFLKDLSEDEKKNFSSKKYEYYVQNGCNSYYHYRDFLEKEPTYFSFAFAVRQGKNDIDFDTYIYLWNDFLSKYYPNNHNEIEDIITQLKYHKSFSQITKDDPNCVKILSRFDSIGTKLLLRTNKRPKLNDKRNHIINYFGVPKFRMGALKIVDINEYYNPRLRQYMENGYVSAFKVVVDKTNVYKKSHK